MPTTTTQSLTRPTTVAPRRTRKHIRRTAAADGAMPALDAASVRAACGYDAARKGAELMQRVLTLAAVRIVMAQSDGFGNECSEDVNQSSTTTSLLEAMRTHPVQGNGREFLEYLLAHEDQAMRLCAVRIIEVRRTYAESGDFDWAETLAHVTEDVESFRQKMLREHATKSLLVDDVNDGRR
jgi:hypothetical protein